jgi:hypothetical protein
MEGESILLLIFIFIILVAVIVIAILYFTYVNKYDESNIFYKNLLEIIKKDTVVDSELTKSDFKITNLDIENRKLSNILDYPNTASEEIENEVDTKIQAAFDDDSSKLSIGFNSNFDSKLNSALSVPPSDLENAEKAQWTNIIGFDYNKAKTYNEIIAANEEDEGFLYNLHNPVDGNVVTDNAETYHRTINNASDLLGGYGDTAAESDTFGAIQPKHITLLQAARTGYDADAEATIPEADGSEKQEALLKNAFYYIANNDLKTNIQDKVTTTDILVTDMTTRANTVGNLTDKKGLNMDNVVFCNTSKCFQASVSGAAMTFTEVT